LYSHKPIFSHVDDYLYVALVKKKQLWFEDIHEQEVM